MRTTWRVHFIIPTSLNPGWGNEAQQTNLGTRNSLVCVPNPSMRLWHQTYPSIHSHFLFNFTELVSAVLPLSCWVKTKIGASVDNEHIHTYSEGLLLSVSQCRRKHAAFNIVCSSSSLPQRVLGITGTSALPTILESRPIGLKRHLHHVRKVRKFGICENRGHFLKA